jgi:hypothetical protein
MTITDFEVIDHGIEHSQYFQGCGVAFSPYAHVVTGIGDDFCQALSDALDQIACEYDLGNIEDLILADKVSYGDDVVPEDSEEIYYHVSIRFNVAEAK